MAFSSKFFRERRFFLNRGQFLPISELAVFSKKAALNHEPNQKSPTIPEQIHGNDDAGIGGGNFCRLAGASASAGVLGGGGAGQRSFSVTGYEYAGDIEGNHACAGGASNVKHQHGGDEHGGAGGETN